MARKQHQLQDETRYCEHCGISYIWSIEEQGLAATGLSMAANGPLANTERDPSVMNAVSEEAISSADEQLTLSDAELGAASTLAMEEPRFCPGCRYLLPPDRRERGFVKWYNRRKGYGFIVRRDAPEIYVNRNSLRRGHLRPDEFVEFAVAESAQGPIAKKVTILPSNLLT